MKKRRKIYTDRFRHFIVGQVRDGASANGLSKKHRVDQTTISRWVREMHSSDTPGNSNPPLSVLPERSDNSIRAKRDSSESLDMLLSIRDASLPRLMQECRGHIIYCRMTACQYPTRQFGQDEWGKIYVALNMCLRDVESMALHLKIDHLAMREIYETILRIKGAWLNYRHEHFASSQKSGNEDEEMQANDCLSEEEQIFDGLICKLRELVVGSRCKYT